MSEAPKPIETRYKGHRFRSRLEARWAVFFDHVGWTWDYEPEGYRMSDGTCYLPDFLVSDTESSFYVEVKGQVTQESICKVVSFSRESEAVVYVLTGTPAQVYPDEHLCIAICGTESLGHDIFKVNVCGRWLTYKTMSEAVRSASSARFEFGESG